MDTDLRRTVEVTLRRAGGLRRGAPIVVGVSGGPDSLALWHLLRTMAHDTGWRLHIAHLNHRLRGPDADGDARFVAQLAAQWGDAVTLEAADVAALAEAEGLSIEEAARQARYAFLARVARRSGTPHIAVAHTADDQAETVLMHLLRGAGLAGLRGMLPVSPLAEYRMAETALAGDEAWAALRLWRPLLDVTRAQVEAYCAAEGLQPRFDRSNLDTTFFRNRLRHDLLPLLATYNPAIKEVLCRTARALADDYAVLHGETLRAWEALVVWEDGASIGLRLEGWRALPPGLARGVLREAVRRLRRRLRNINWEHIETAYQIARDIAHDTGTQATLPQGLQLTLRYDTLVIGDAGAAMPGAVPQLWVERLPLRIPGETPLPGSDWSVVAAWLAPAAVPDDWQRLAAWEALLDADALGDAVVLRVRRPGDRFQPLGMGGRTVKLSEFFINRKIAALRRDRWPLLEAPFGIAWVPGLQPDERARLTPQTRRVLHLCFVRH